MARKHVAYFSSQPNTWNGLGSIEPSNSAMFIPGKISPTDAQYLRSKAAYEQERVRRMSNTHLGNVAGLGLAGVSLLAGYPRLATIPAVAAVGNTIYQTYKMNEAANRFASAPLPDYGVKQPQQPVPEAYPFPAQ